MNQPVKFLQLSEAKLFNTANGANFMDQLSLNVPQNVRFGI